MRPWASQHILIVFQNHRDTGQHEVQIIIGVNGCEADELRHESKYFSYGRPTVLAVHRVSNGQFFMAT